MDLQKKKKKAEALRLQRAKDEEAAKLAAEAASPPGSGLHDALIEPTPTPGRPGDYNTGSGLHDALVNQNPAGPVDTAPPPVIDQAAAQGAAAPPPVVDQAAAQSAAAPPPVVNQAAAQGAAAPPPVVNQAAAQAEAAPPPVINQAAVQGAAGAGTTPPVVDQAAAQGSGGAMSGASLTDAITEPVVNQAAAQAAAAPPPVVNQAAAQEAAAPPPVVDPAPVVNQAAAQGAAGPPVDQANAQAAAVQPPPVAAQTNPMETAPPPATAAPVDDRSANVSMKTAGESPVGMGDGLDLGGPEGGGITDDLFTDETKLGVENTGDQGNVFENVQLNAQPQFSMDDVTRMVNEQLGNWQTDFMNQFNTGRDEWRAGVESGLADQRQTWQDQFTAERDKALQDWGSGRDASRAAWRADALSGLQGDMSSWQDQFGKQYQADRSLDQMGQDQWRAGALSGLQGDMSDWQDQFSRDYQTDRDLDQFQRDKFRQDILGGQGDFESLMQDKFSGFSNQNEMARNLFETKLRGGQSDLLDEFNKFKEEQGVWRGDVEGGIGDWQTGFEHDASLWRGEFGDERDALFKQLGLDLDASQQGGFDDLSLEFNQLYNATAAAKTAPGFTEEDWDTLFNERMSNYDFSEHFPPGGSNINITNEYSPYPWPPGGHPTYPGEGVDGPSTWGPGAGAYSLQEGDGIKFGNEVWDTFMNRMNDPAFLHDMDERYKALPGLGDFESGVSDLELDLGPYEDTPGWSGETISPDRPDALADMPEITDYSDILNESYLNQVMGRLEAPSAYDERMEQITSGKESVVNKKWDDAIDRFMSNAGVQDDFGSPKFQATLAEMESNRARELGQIHSDWGMEAAGADEDMHRGRIGDLGYALQGERGRVADELARYGAAVSGADQQYRDWLSDTSAAYYQPYLWGDQGLGMMLGGIGSTMNPIAGVGAAMGGLSNVAAAGGAQAGRDMQNWGNLFNAISPAISNWWGSRNNTGSVNSGYGGGGGIVPL